MNEIMENIEKLIIFPDIHGRKFWRKAINYLPNEKYGFIFLGDYFDPYEDFEGIDEDKAIANFQIMFSTFSTIPNRVVWLIGNHDYHYWKHLWNEYGCRRSFWNLKNISQFFENQRDKFKIAYELFIGDKKYLFTHAGVNSGWAKEFENQEDAYKADVLNKLLETNDHKLWEISAERYGPNPNGSCLWSDVYEMEYSEHPENIFQIFGHTLATPDPDSPIITENFAMLDSRKPYILDLKTGKLEEFIE